MALLGMGAAGLLVYLRRSLPAPTSPGDHLETLYARLASIEVKVEGLPSLWKEERERSKRAQETARKYRSDAEDRLEEVQDLIAEHGAESGERLRDPDATGGEEGGVYPVRPSLGDPPASDLDARVEAVAHLLR